MKQQSKLRKSVAFLIACLLDRSFQFQTSFCRTRANRPRTGEFFGDWRRRPTEINVLSDTSRESIATQDSLFATSSELDERIVKLCTSDRVEEAVELLMETKSDDRPSEAAYCTILSILAATDQPSESSLQQIELLFDRMKSLSESGQQTQLAPTASAYNLLALAWSKTSRGDAGERCCRLLSELWQKYYNTTDSRFVPLKSTYVSTLTALARSGKGREAAERAEQLLEEMEQFRPMHPDLAPTTICVNIVLHAWSRSKDRDATKRCEAILDRMEESYFRGRKELAPNTTSFNTYIDALAKSNERGSERRAEALLERMETLSCQHEDLKQTCQPDEVSYNTVLNCWARSRNPNAARRAEAILRHMDRRYAEGITTVRPDRATYNTVLTAWSRSGSDEAPFRAQEVLRRMEKAYESGNIDRHPTAMSYNIIINAWAKSKDPDASVRAWDIFNKMKDLFQVRGKECCRPDVFSYTSLIDALAKSSDKKSADRAVELLHELENEYMKSHDPSLKPNIRTYTSVIHAISRSRSRPERAEEILNRLEEMYQSGESDVLPDVVCYDALVNAYGWSNEKGRSLKCYEIYQKMLDLYTSGTNVHVKPDIITCNSVLNACAYEPAESDADKAAILNVVVRTLEDFQSRAPEFGWPNHITYANVLLAIGKHSSSDDDKRMNLAEATFWQCCQSGHVSVLVINNLYNVLPWDRFSSLLGNALLSQEHENLHFNWRLLPQEWTRFAPRPKERKNSPSSKRQSK